MSEAQRMEHADPLKPFLARDAQLLLEFRFGPQPEHVGRFIADFYNAHLQPLLLALAILEENRDTLGCENDTRVLDEALEEFRKLVRAAP